MMLITNDAEEQTSTTAISKTIISLLFNNDTEYDQVSATSALLVAAERKRFSQHL
jgi:hypothetical protein